MTQNETNTAVDVERGIAQIRLHFEGEGTYLLFRSRRKINKRLGDMFYNYATSKGRVGRVNAWK